MRALSCVLQAGLAASKAGSWCQPCMVNHAVELMQAGSWTGWHRLGSHSHNGNSISFTDLCEMKQQLAHLEICTAHKRLVGCGEVSNR